MSQSTNHDHSNDDAELQRVISSSFHLVNDATTDGTTSTTTINDTTNNLLQKDEHHQTHTKNDADNEDLDLENAIGDVFKQFDFNSINLEQEIRHNLDPNNAETEQSHHEVAEYELVQHDHLYLKQQAETEPSADHIGENVDATNVPQNEPETTVDTTRITGSFDLEHQSNATDFAANTSRIGENEVTAINSTLTAPDTANKSHIAHEAQNNTGNDVSDAVEPESEHPDMSSDHKMNIDDAIGEAFRAAMDNDQEKASNKEQDTSMDDVIGDAFKSAIENAGDEDTEKSKSMDDVIGNAFNIAMQNMREDAPSEDQFSGNDRSNGDTSVAENKHEPSSIEEMSMEDAIGDAFRSAIEESNTRNEQNRAREEDATFPGDSGDSSGAVSKNDSETHEKRTEMTRDTQQEEHNKQPNPDDDMNLEDAIGDAFKNIFETSAQEQRTEPDNRKSHNEQEIDDWNLENTIGDSFKTITLGQDTSSSFKPETYSNKSNETDANDQDTDLNEAIGNAFNDIFKVNKLAVAQSSVEHLHDSHNDLKETEHVSYEKYDLPESKDDEDSDVDLDEAIGNAFRNAIPQLTDSAMNTDSLNARDLELAVSNALEESHSHEHKSQDKEETLDDSELNQLISDSFQKLLGNNQQENVRNDLYQTQETEDINMEDAISQAFKSAMDESTKSSHPNLNQPHMDVSSLVHNLVQQMNNKDGSEQNRNKLAFPQNVIDELAMEITSQVQENIADDSAKKSNTTREMPQIDDNILAHFQNEAYKEDQSRRHQATEIGDRSHSANDAHLQQTIVNAVKNVISSNRGGNDQVEQKEEVLDHLQMSDILQNAFNMAMQNPDELLNDLQMDEDTDAESRKTLPANDLSKKLASTLAKFPHSISASTANFLESLKLSNDIDWSDRDAAPEGSSSHAMGEKKLPSLSKTKSLGKQRSAANDSNQYSSALSLEEELKSDNNAVSQMSPQLLNVIGTITSRIANSGITTPSDANILAVIKTMRNAFSTSLSDSPSLARDSPSVTDIISSYKSKHEKDAMINSLSLAKSYIDSSVLVNADKSLAKSLIDSVLKKFEVEPKIDAKFHENLISKTDIPNLISSINSSIVSFISNFTATSKYSRSLYGEKFRADSPEYKEKIRIENRERKKKWREENAERNKDNDLRSRVIKRANAMFGESESETKRSWVEDEFNRRREKRIAKQKKDDEKFPGMFISDSKVKEKENLELARDENLVRPITDIFNILSASSQFGNPEATLTATSVATATAAALYVNNNPGVELKQVNSVVTSILSNLMDNANASGHQERISSLTRGANFSYKLNPNSRNISDLSAIPSVLVDPELSSLMKNNFGGTKGFINRLSRTLNGNTSSTSNNPLIDFHNLNLQEKRDSSGALPYPKKYKVDDSFQINKVPQVGINTNSGSSSLKMPQYRKPNWNYVAHAKDTVEHPTLTLPLTSPFISNKMNFGSPSGIASSSLGLRKPGSFQRPTTNAKSKGKGFGFPPLYSASFTLK